MAQCAENCPVSDKMKGVANDCNPLVYMVPPRRLERPTPRLGILCSILTELRGLNFSQANTASNVWHSPACSLFILDIIEGLLATSQPQNII